MVNDKLTNEYIWHYTRAEFLTSIRTSGALKPKSEAELYQAAGVRGAVVSEVPFIWFSSDQNFEPLCTQLGGGLSGRHKTWQELASQHGAIRFGINPKDIRLLNWEQTINARGGSREDRRLQKKLVPKARRMGSYPERWFTSMVPIPVDQLRFQMWLYDEWADADIELARLIQRYAND